MMGYIYFIACRPMEAVKIGFTTGHPSKRLAQMQTGCPAPLELFAYCPGTMDEERRLHDAFGPLHIQGEWFRFEGKLFDMAAYLSDASSRESFLNAVHDVLFTGLQHPLCPMSSEAYAHSGDWRPLQHLLGEDVN